MNNITAYPGKNKTRLSVFLLFDLKTVDGLLVDKQLHTRKF